jgi:hypothetical protein
MSVQQEVLRLVDAARKIRRPAPVGVKRLDEAPVSGPDLVRSRSWLKPQDLVRFLMRHRAVLKIGPIPEVRTSLSVFTPTGKPAVQIGFEEPSTLNVAR